MVSPCRKRMRSTVTCSIILLGASHYMNAGAGDTGQRVISDFSEQDAERWRMVTDGVMGGRSSGKLEFEHLDGRDCLRLRGQVSLENNGGFVQMALDWSAEEIDDVGAYMGLALMVYGNGEDYNIHLRTQGLWLPWQAYRATFETQARWTTVELPFAGFTPYKTGKPLAVDKIKRIGIVAIGREFTADVCVARLALYR